MAFESDDDDKRRVGKAAAKSDPSELGKLDAELPPGQRRSSMPPGSDADEAIDAATLAALSKGQGGRPAVAPPAARGSSFGWVIGLAIGFAAGVPAGALLFPRTTVVSVPAAPAKLGDQQLAAAEARARAADEVAAAVHPLPAQRSGSAQQPAAADEHAQPAAAATPPAEAEPAPAPAPAPTQPAAPSPPAAATAVASGKTAAPPNAQAREAARAATAALNSGGAKPAEAPAAQPITPPPSAAAAVSDDPHAPDARSVDQLLDQALSSSTAKKEQERAERQEEALVAANTIPVSPSRDDVTRAMTVLLPAIRGCAAGQSGLATVSIIVKNDGRVETVSVTGSPFEGERSGRCMEGVVRHAKFPRFQQSSFRIQFPFAIQ